MTEPRGLEFHPFSNLTLHGGDGAFFIDLQTQMCFAEPLNNFSTGPLKVVHAALAAARRRRRLTAARAAGRAAAPRIL